ncbi:Ig-like domain-containing protein, partial [Candidatus Saccharibacteria bacterium]|nr:Ig-like domain-containing protein [Candidatus Saccharibacteria bacterium]
MAKKYRLVMTLTLLLVAMLVFPTIAQAATNTSPTAARNAALAELTRVVFNVGSDVYSVNGVNRTSDVRTIGAHVPLRFMAEAFGGEVGWDEDRGMAVVTINGRTQHIPNRGPETLVVNDRTMLHISSNLFSYFGLTVSVSEDGERITVTERFLEFNPINVSQIRDAARQSPFFSSRDGRTVVFVPSTNLLLPASFETDDRIYSYSVGFEAVEGFTLLRRGELVILSVTSRAKPSSIQNISGTFTGDELVARGHATRSMTIGDFQVLNLNANWRNIPLAEGSSTITVNGVRYNYYVTRLDSTTRIRTANAGDTIVLYMARYTTPPSQPSGGGGGSYRPPIVTPETTVSLNPRNVNLQSGHLAPAGSNTTSVRVTVSNNQGFSVHVQDPSVATAVRSGSNIHITWAGIGTTTYHVVSDDGRGIASGTITSSLNGDILVTGFNLDVTDMTLLIGQTQTANVIGRQPISATELINWSSSNSQVASVNSNGQITAHTAGNATITARTAVGGLTRTVSVTVVDGAIGAKMELAKIGNGFAGNRLEVPFGTNAANTAIVEALILAQAQNQVGSGYVVSMVSSNYDSTSLVWTGRFIVSQIGNAMNTATDVSNRNILINVAAGPNETDAEKELNGIEVSLPSEWEIPADSQLTDVAAIEAMVMQVANANVASGYSVSVETTQYIPPQSPGLWTGRLTITSVTNPADTATRIITIVVHYEVATKHTVTFVHTEGTLISGDLVQEVVEGQDAVPPVIERDGFTLS